MESMSGIRNGSAPSAVVFDLDGTLVDTVGTRIAAWLRAFEEREIPAQRAQVAQLIGSDGRRLARIVAEAAGRTVDESLTESIDRRAGDIYDLLNTDPRPLPGVHIVLNMLEARRIPWAIATSSRSDQVGASIHALHLSSRPKVIDGSHVKHAKPAPDLLLAAAQELALEPADIWYVGDSIWDMNAARTAGMPAIGVATGVATPMDLEHAGAQLTLESLEELVPILAGSRGPTDTRP
jgi:HAD superfamily hydrolase (TIGR01509 family)